MQIKPVRIMKILFPVGNALLLLLVFAACRRDALNSILVDPLIPPYRKMEDAALEDRILIKGSNTLSGVLIVLADEFCQIHPEVQIRIEGKGSEFGIEGLLDGSAMLAAMSRPLTEAEKKRLHLASGFPVRQLPIARDAICVYVHRNNPLRQLDLVQLSSIFEKSDDSSDTLYWKDFGVGGRAGEMEIKEYGRTKDSGTRQVFEERLKLGSRMNYKRTAAGASSLIQMIEQNRAAIGYSGIGHATAGVRILALNESGKPPLLPKQSTVQDGSYPITRFLYLAFFDQETDATPAIRQFLRFIYSIEGQNLLAANGFFPLSAIEIGQVSGF